MAVLKPKLRLDTKDTCFLCLKPRSIIIPVVKDIDSDSDGDDENPASFSYHSFIRHLNLNMRKIFNECQMKPLSVLEKAEVYVPLCEQCSPLASRFYRLYKELEIIRLHLNSCIQNLHSVMVEAESDVEQLNTYSEIPSDIAHASIVKHLRKETIEKCTKKIKSIPRVSLRMTSRTGHAPQEISRPNETSEERKSTKTMQVNVLVTKLPPPPPPVVLEKLPASASRKRTLTKDNENREPSAPDIKRLNLNSASASSGSMKGPSIRRRVLKCSICGGDYFDSFALQKHKLTHTSDNIQDLTFPCQYCDEVFKFYFTQRAHLLKAHPVQVLKAHVPEDTTDEEIKSTLTSLVERNRDPLEDGKSRCLICLRNYGQGLELESHVLVTHFDTVLSGLKRGISKIRKNKTNVSACTKDANTGANSAGNVEPVPETSSEFVLDPMTGVRNDA